MPCKDLPCLLINIVFNYIKPLFIALMSSLRNKHAETLILTACVWVCEGIIEFAGLYQCEITCNAIDTHVQKTTLTESSQAWCREAMYVCVVCAVVQSLLSLSGDLVPVRGPHCMRGMFVWMCANVHLYAALAQINTGKALKNHY